MLLNRKREDWEEFEWY